MDPLAPLATYPVRTAPGYWLVAGMLVLLALLGGATMAFVVLTTGSTGVGFIAIAALSALAPIAYFLGTAAYRIASGRGTIKLYPDRIEIPSASGAPRSFARADLTASSQPLALRYRVGAITSATVRRSHLLRFHSGTHHRALSTLTLEQPAKFLADLTAYLDKTP